MKPFTEIYQQLEILEARGLLINDKERAKEILSRTNYYNLINGYKDYFLQGGMSKEHYRQNVCFEDIYALYSFDYELRAILLKYLLRFESNLKAKVSYRFSEAFNKPDAYLQPQNFDLESSNSRYIPALIANISNIIKEKEHKKSSIRHYLKKHHHVPLWVLISYFTFGNTQYFFLCLKPKIKSVIAKDFSLEFQKDYELSNTKLMPEMIEAIIKAVNYFRNVCAHEERLYNFTLHKKARSTSLAKTLDIPSDLLKNGNVFTLISFLKLVTEKSLYEKLISELETLFDKYQGEIFSISLREIITEMGFPFNWKNLLIPPNKVTDPIKTPVIRKLGRSKNKYSLQRAYARKDKSLKK